MDPMTAVTAADELLHVIFLRHGRTTDNANGVISGGAADPELVPEGRDQARAAHQVYTALEENGIVNDDTPVFTTDRRRAVDTAKMFTGRENGELFTTDQRLLERLLGDWDSKLTERLQKEIKAIPGFAPPTEESPAEHKAHVFNCLDERIADAHGRPIIIVSHGGTTRRISSYFGIEEGLDVQNAVPHHAVSNDGGKSWELKRFRLDAEGQLEEEVLPKKLAQVASIKRTLESILVEHAPQASLSATEHVLTIEVDITTNREAIDALANDLGQLLIGKCYDAGTVVVEDAAVVVKLDRVQAEILQRFADLKGIELH